MLQGVQGAVRVGKREHVDITTEHVWSSRVARARVHAGQGTRVIVPLPFFPLLSFHGAFVFVLLYHFRSPVVVNF